MPAKAKSARNSSVPTERLVDLLLRKPAEVRAKMLLDLVSSRWSQPAELQAVLAQLFQQLEARSTTAEAAELTACYERALAELAEGPVRPATFVGDADGDIPGPRPRVRIITPDAQERFPSLHPRVQRDSLTPGATVYLDPVGAIVLGTSPTMPDVGQLASFLRRIPGSEKVEVQLRDEQVVLYAARPVLEAEHNGLLARGDRLLVCTKRMFAFAVLPPEDRRYRFLNPSQMAPVFADRDIGKPHWVLDWLVRRTRVLLFRPDWLRRFGLRPRCAVLFVGPPGTGKTLTIHAFLHEFGRLLVERTGRTDLGSRVIRARVSELFSEWLGRTEKQIDELFNDIQQLADEEVGTASGERLRLPVVVLFEEVEGIALRRGQWDGGIHDRIMSTLLQRFDTASLGERPILLLATSNRPDLIDAAMWRRLAGVQAHFARLDRADLAAVLGKKILPEYPLAGEDGQTAEERRSRLIDRVVDWFYDTAVEDHRLVEIRLRDGGKVIKHRWDFLTGAVVEQAVSNAIDQVVLRAEQAVAPHVCLSAEELIEAFRHHLDSLADNLTTVNVADYVDLPDHTSAAVVRRLRPLSKSPNYSAPLPTDLKVP